MSGLDAVAAIIAQSDGLNLSEADTRHQVIDPLIHDVFSWPRARTACELHIHPGYADYVLTRPDSQQILLIEAKRSGNYFELPSGRAAEDAAFYCRLDELLTVKEIANAVEQVRKYCLDVGCDVAAITNGQQWVFFRTFEQGQDWRKLKAFVVPSLRYFQTHFVEASNHLSYHSITSKGSLRRLLLDKSVYNRELFHPKKRVSNYEVSVESNAYASSLRPLADRYFGVINESDVVFMDKCYVSEREYDMAMKKARRRIEDTITPFLESYNIADFQDSESGGAFGRRVTKSVSGTRATETIVLFGGKGVGKSTFLRRLLFHKPPQIIKKNAVTSIIDLLDEAQDLEGLRKVIWRNVVRALDFESLLSAGRARLCTLFKDRYDVALNQDLCGLSESSEAFNVKLNALVADWKQDLPYVASRLSLWAKQRHKVPVIVVDNTDQFDNPVQDECFTIAREVSATVECLVVVSMREERFYASSIKGVLDAYQNAGFHISSPDAKEVFRRRLIYVQDVLKSDARFVSERLTARIDRDVCSKFFGVILSEFARGGSSQLVKFLVAVSHGNIRMALELFRDFLVSGYTNVREMTQSPSWTMLAHQVIKPFMIPSRFFYDENRSRVPNIYQIRFKSHGSHFTSFRILSKLLVNQDDSNPPFVPLGALRSYFMDTYSMGEDFEQNVDVLLRHGLIESNNRVEAYSAAVDSVRITGYGRFLLQDLARTFTYLELVATDTALGDQGAANQIAELSNQEYVLYMKHDRLARVTARLARAKVFVEYLASEETREARLYKGAEGTMFTDGLVTELAREEELVKRSAEKAVRRHLERESNGRSSEPTV